MKTFKDYVNRSIDSLVAAFSAKDKTDQWIEEETQFFDFSTGTIVKGEAVPVHIEYRLPMLSEEDIRHLAYLKWEQAGCPTGDGREFWEAAEQELNSPLEDLLLQR